MSRFFRLENFKVDALKFAHLGAGIDDALIEPLGEIGGFSAVSEYHICRKSIDSRRGRPELVYTLIVEAPEPPAFDGACELSAEQAAEELAGAVYEIPECAPGAPQPIVVGAGPAGLFAGWVLAAAGMRPIILERGKQVEERALDVARFTADRELDEHSNYLIGEGGAGTFSDGKLFTRGRDPRGAWILARLVEAGAAKETLYLKRPHLGSDRLPGIVANMRRAIIALGGEFRFNSEVVGVQTEGGVCSGVRLASGESLSSPTVVIAVGLGARGLTESLLKVAAAEPKGFQIGCRIEHPQAFIDFRQYRSETRADTLGAAEYNFVSPQVKGRLGASTFCMCPGGAVIPATTFSGELSTNGMSCFARDGKYANSAIVVTPPRLDFPTAKAAFDLLSRLGRDCFNAGGGDYTFPAQDAEAFMRGEVALKDSNTGALTGLRAFDLNTLLPREAARALNKALRVFDHKCPGFIAEGKLIGIESYVSSPMRFLRDESGASTLGGLYFAGEGAGMAGGILSAAVDGMKIAEYIIGKYRK